MCEKKEDLSGSQRDGVHNFCRCVCVRARVSVCERNIEGVFVCECDVHSCQLVEVAQTPIPGF